MSTRWKAVLDYWFGEPELSDAYFEKQNERWFGGSEKVDEEIRKNFTQDVEAAERGELKDWETRPESCLALVVLLDQFSMNMERDSRRCYERSALALTIAKRAVDQGFDRKVHFTQRSFFYLPFEHSEDMADQKRSMQLYRGLCDDAPAALRPVAEYYLDYARQHFEVIEKYGRFPGRNEVFGRKSRPEELQYLEDGGWF